MKKFLTMLLAIVLTATIAIGGTVAYLTQDLETKKNVFTVGDIDISLDEETGIIGEGGEVTDNNVSGSDYTGIMPGDYLEKKVTVTNNGTKDAYVAVFVKLNNVVEINNAIDEHYEALGYTAEQIQAIYDNVFDGWGLNYSKDTDGDGVNDAGMRLTITGDDMPEYVMQVDSVKTLDEYWLSYTGNWFSNEGDEDAIIPFDGYYTTDMEENELLYCYYLYLPAGETATLFNGLNVPAEFDADQLAMFENLEIDIWGEAIQADNIPGAAKSEEEAITAIEILRGEYVGWDDWDGTVDTDWYDAAETEYTIKTAEELAGFAQLVDEGVTFEGKTVNLGINIDLKEKLFEPIGSYRKNTPFMGTFEGNDLIIRNLSQNTWELDNGYYYDDLGLGLFGCVEDAEIKNLTVDSASISGESAICGAVAGCAYGDTTFENITVTNSEVNDYQYYAGGIVGWASGNQTYKNINMDASSTVGSQWGDFGNANGGIVGGIGSSGSYHFEDCTIACRIDATNDIVSAYQWYNYRNSGMIIGRVPQTITNGEVQTVATPTNVTCQNVTVIYDDWANYTYCEFAGTGYPYVRVQGGVSVDPYSNVRYGHPTDANGNTVVDDSHVHNEGEDCKLLIAFDQLFGGPANHRYCYYGISEFAGVEIVYNN